MADNDIPVVILAGGKGMQLDSQDIPKSLVNDAAREIHERSEPA